MKTSTYTRDEKRALAAEFMAQPSTERARWAKKAGLHPSTLYYWHKTQPGAPAAAPKRDRRRRPAKRPHETGPFMTVALPEGVPAPAADAAWRIELDAIAGCLEKLEPLEPSARARVIDWVVRRLAMGNDHIAAAAVALSEKIANGEAPARG